MKAQPSLQDMVKHMNTHNTTTTYLFTQSAYGGIYRYRYTCSFVLGLVGLAPPSVRWTCLMLDLQYTLSVYLNQCYSHLKSIKLCANIAVKNMFTSGLLLDPGETEIRAAGFFACFFVIMTMTDCILYLQMSCLHLNGNFPLVCVHHVNIKREAKMYPSFSSKWKTTKIYLCLKEPLQPPTFSFDSF